MKLGADDFYKNIYGQSIFHNTPGPILTGSEKFFGVMSTVKVRPAFWAIFMHLKVHISNFLHLLHVAQNRRQLPALPHP